MPQPPTTHLISQITNHQYLGDGIYAEFDGLHIVLFTLDGIKIFINPEVMRNLINYKQLITQQFPHSFKE